MSRDYSEYKASELDKHMQSHKPENGIYLENYKNNADIDCDSKTVVIHVDCKYEYFEIKNSLRYDKSEEFMNFLEKYIDKISEIKNLVSSNTDYRQHFLEKQKNYSDSYKFDFDLMDEDLFLSCFEEDILCDIFGTINLFYLSKNTFNLSEGILDFIYADLSTPLNRLIKILESYSFADVFCSDNHKIDNFKNYESMIYFDMSMEIIKPLMYSSFYTAICPPKFDFNKDIVEQIKWYGNYLISKQKEYREIIEFCYDEDYYPDFFLGASPKARYFLYRTLKGLPTESHRIELMCLERLPEGRKFRMFDDTFKYNDLNGENLNKEDSEFAKDSDLSIQEMSQIVSLYRYIEEGYVFSNIDEILELEFTKMLKTDIKIKKCKRCGKYFRLKGKYHTEYCSRIADGETRNCREIAASDKYKERTAVNQALQIYNKYYKRYHARLKVNQIKSPDFYTWKYKTLIMRSDCEDGKVSPEEYETWNESYFPNRKKKETK